MNMVKNHMEQISLSAAAISDLPFPPPKIFTNALLHPHDITSLIRDTEVHERALFKPIAPEPGSLESYTRRSTHYGSAGQDASRGSTALAGLRSSTAVGRILGSDMVERIKRSERIADSKGTKTVDIDSLLDGAERLSSVYPVPGALDRIKTLRARHQELLTSIEYYEDKVAEQTVLLDRVHHPPENEGHGNESAPQSVHVRDSYSAEDFQKEEDEMRELEEKRRTLEDRVSGMKKDLGGLRR